MTENTAVEVEPTFKPVYKEIPNHLAEAASVDAMVKTMPGDGACLYNCASEWLLGSYSYMTDLRREAHSFIVQNFDFYKQFICLPYCETVGVGTNRKQIYIQTYDEMIKFLQSEDSMFCFSSSSLDLANIATMFNIRIIVFVFSSNGSVVPRWDWIHPNPELVMKSPRYNPSRETHDLWLFHEDNCHYDVLVPCHLCVVVEEATERF